MIQRGNNTDKGIKSRENIQNAALRLFAKKGYKETTMRDIAREAKVTPGLYYRYFRSKDDLLKAIIKSHAVFMNEVSSLLTTSAALDAATIRGIIRKHHQELRLYFQLLMQQEKTVKKMMAGHLPDIQDFLRRIPERDKNRWLTLVGLMATYIFTEDDTLLNLMSQSLY